MLAEASWPLSAAVSRDVLAGETQFTPARAINSREICPRVPSCPPLWTP